MADEDERTLNQGNPGAAGQPITLASLGLVEGDLLGQGGMGEVRRAWDPILRRWVALKRLRADRSTPEWEARLLQEAQVTGQLEHPGVLPVHAIGMDEGGNPAFTMKEVRGRSLRDVIRETHEQVGAGALGGREAQQRLVRLLLRVCEAVEFAHSRGVVHRDIKPNNVMIGAFGEVIVLDWGLARSGRMDRYQGEAAPEGEEVRTDADEQRLELTEAGRVAGTPQFMAPEQILGDASPPVDIWALGGCLWVILTGAPPFPGGRQTWSQRKLSAAPSTLDGPLKGQIDREIDAIAMKALAFNPSSRYPSARDMQEDLEAWLDGRVVKAAPQTLEMRLQRWVRERLARRISPTLAVGLAAASALAALGGVRVAELRRQADASEAWALAEPQLPARYAASPDGARAWVEDFARRPERAGTAAVSEAWLALATLEAERKALAPAAEDAMTAFALADSQEQREAALAVAADAWSRRADFRALGALEREGDLAEALPEERREELARQRALLDLDIEAAWPGLDESTRAHLAFLREARPLDPGVVDLVDTDGDRIPEPVYQDETKPPGRDARGWHLPGTFHVGWQQGTEFIAFSQDRLWRVTREGEAREFAAGRPKRVGSVMMGRDANQELVVYGETEIEPFPYAPGQDLPGIPVATTNFDVDGDGKDEAVIGTGPPYGFSLHMLKEREDGLWTSTFVDRKGMVGGVVRVSPTVLAALTTDENGSLRLFGADSPFGDPCKILLYEPIDGVLTLRGEESWPLPTLCPGSSGAADLDGDGQNEVLASAIVDQRHILLIRFGDGSVSVIGGLEVSHVLQADEDPADEMVVQRHDGGKTQPILLGAGGSPIQPLPAAPPLEPTGDPMADLLQAISPRSAAEWLLHPSGSLDRYAEALDRAAALYLEAGDIESALRARLLRARTRPADAQGWIRAGDALFSLGRWEEAAALAEEADATAPEASAALRARLQAWEKGRLVMDLSRPLPPQVQVRVPEALTPDFAHRSLRLRVPAGAGEILRVPLRTTGEGAWIRLKGRIERTEWGSGVDISLGDEEGALSPVVVHGGGAGGLLRRSWLSTAKVGQCEAARVGTITTIDAATITEAFDIYVGSSRPGDPVELSGLKEVRRNVCPITVGPGQPWTLQVKARHSWGGNNAPIAELVITSWEMGGVALADASPEPPPAPIAWLRGNAPLTTDLLRDPLMAGLARLDPRVVDRVRAELGDSAGDLLFSLAWKAVTRWHPRDPEVASALLGAGPLPEISPDVRASLILAQGEMLLRRGHSTAAELVLRQVLAIGRDATWEPRFGALLRLAELLEARGDAAGAASARAEAASLPPDADLAERLMRAEGLR